MKIKGESSEEESRAVQKPNLNEHEDKSTAIIAYIPIFGIIIALVKNKEEKSTYTSFHIRQMLGIYCMGLVLLLVVIFQKLGMTIHFLGMLWLVILWALGLLSAVNGEKKKVFLFGTVFQKWFKGIK